MASNARYEAAILAQFDTSQLQAQLNALNNKVNIKPQIQLGQKEIQDYVDKWNNTLTRMQVGKKSVFNMPEVKQDFKDLTALIDDFAMGGQTSVKDVTAGFDNLRTSVKVAGNELLKTNQDAKVGIGGWVNELGIAISRTASWTIAMTAFFGVIHQVQDAFSYVVELNKEMTNIKVLQTEGASSASEINDLAKSYNKLAIDMGVTTIEVAKGSVEWLRQGKTVEETQALLRSTLMMSKLGALDSAKATEYLTSTLNGFNIEAKDATKVVDVLVGLDNKYATSVSEIAEALSRSSNSAQQAGVSFEKLSAMITVVSSVTRKDAIDKIGAL
jgi:phage tail tube protein FII